MELRPFFGGGVARSVLAWVAWVGSLPSNQGRVRALVRSFSRPEVDLRSFLFCNGPTGNAIGKRRRESTLFSNLTSRFCPADEVSLPLKTGLVSVVNSQTLK